MTKRILLQFDPDSQPSSFDSVVAADAGVDHLFRYGNVHTTSVTSLVHGAMFTRGGDNLKNTAVFIGGSDVRAAETLFRVTQETFFGPVRVSVMLDANGCNTTASAAVVAASRHAQLDGAKAVVLGGTGPVGRRAAQLLASDGANVTLTSRSLDRAQSACDQISGLVSSGSLTAAAPATEDQVLAVLADAQIVIACGAAGVQLADRETILAASALKVAIDLNAVPPAGIEGIGVTDKAKPISEGNHAIVGYGAIGVGGLKMRTHKTAIESLFETNDRVLDAAEIYAIAKSIDQQA